MYKKLLDSERETKEWGFDSNAERLKQDYLDMFEGDKSNVTYTAQYDENIAIRTTYLGMLKMRTQNKLKAENKALII